MDETALIEKIMKKKEFSGLAKFLVKNEANNYINTHKIQIETLSPKEFKLIVKEIRAKLRDLSGRFQKSSKNRKRLLEENKITELLKTHSSTAERIEFYPELKNIISKLNPKSILDLGCGLNPIAISSKQTKYYALDIKEDELALLEYFFKKEKINGKTISKDLRDKNIQLPKTDLCLIFKVLDIIDRRNRKLTKELIKNLKCKNIIASFSTKKLSGRPMNKPQRIWFETILKKLNLPFRKIFSQNEIFYIISKTRETTGRLLRPKTLLS